MHTALGVVLQGREHGAIKRLAASDMSRAIAIATAQRQRAGHIVTGTRTLTPDGRVWQRAKKRALTAPVVAGEVVEWERLVALTRKKAKRVAQRFVLAVSYEMPADGPAARDAAIERAVGRKPRWAYLDLKTRARDLDFSFTSEATARAAAARVRGIKGVRATVARALP
jgi:hypothetical protein